MRIRPSLRYGLFNIFVLAALTGLSLSISAQDTPTKPPEPSWEATKADMAEWEATKDPIASWEATQEPEAEMTAWEATEDAMASWGADTAAAPLTLVWQTTFTPETALISPADIAIDKDGNVYVTTQSMNTVKKFDSDGNLVTEWGGKGDGEGEFSLSFGVGVDSDSNVYVTDFYNKRIQKFDSDGKFLLQWPNEPSTSPAFVAVDLKGNVFVDEFPPQGEHFVQKFDSWGMLLDEWGNANKEFAGQIEDIAVDLEGNLYVADFVAHRIQKLDPNGKVVASFGGELSKEGNGRFENPFGVTVDNEGYIYVLDKYFLQKLDWEGNCVAQWSIVGGELDGAANVAVDGEGYIYVFAKSDVTAANGKTVNVLLLKKFQQSES